MRMIVNQGRFLELVGSLEIVPPSGPIRTPIVIDRESGRVVTLVELLETFREDPMDNVIGTVRITIVAGGGFS